MDPIHTALIYAVLCAVGHGMVLTDKGWASTRNGLITGSLLLAAGLLFTLGSCSVPIIVNEHSGFVASFMTVMYILLSVFLLLSSITVTAARRTMDAAFALVALLFFTAFTLLYTLPWWMITTWLLSVIIVFVLLVILNAGMVGVSAEMPQRRWSHPFTFSTSLIGLFLIIGWVIPTSYPARDYFTSLSLDNKVLGILIAMIGFAGVFVHRHASLSLYSLGVIWCGVLLVADGVTLFWKNEQRIILLSLMSLAGILQIYLDGIHINNNLQNDHSITWRIFPHSLTGHQRKNQDHEIY